MARPSDKAQALFQTKHKPHFKKKKGKKKSAKSYFPKQTPGEVAGDSPVGPSIMHHPNPKKPGDKPSPPNDFNRSSGKRAFTSRGM